MRNSLHETHKAFAEAMGIAVFCLSVIMCAVIYFNVIGALILNGWEWIVTNWLPDTPSIVFAVFSVLFCHVVIIIGLLKIK